MLEKLLFALNDCAWAYNLSKQTYVFISPNIHSILGVTANQFSEDKDLWHKIAIAEDHALILNIHNSLKLDEWTEAHYRVKVDNEIRWIYEKKTLFIDNADQTIILSVVKDVTDRSAIDYHLNNSLGDFSILFEAGPNPMWIYEIPSLRIVKVNQAATEVYGYRQDEFLTMTIRDVRPKIDLAAFNEYIFRKGVTKGILQGYNSAGIWMHQNKKGEIIYAEITGHEIKYNKSSCRIIVATNVTERVKYQQERAKHEKFE